MCSGAAVGAGIAILSWISNKQGADAQAAASAADYRALADQADREAEMRDKEAVILDQQAAISEIQAKNTIVDGWKAVAQFRIEGDQELGDLRSELGASGFEVNTGTNVDLQTDVALTTEVDAQTMKYNSRLEAFGHEQEAFKLSFSAYKSRFEASQEREKAKSYRKASRRAGSSSGGLLGINIGGITI